jgi:hypothetical protein
MSGDDRRPDAFEFFGERGEARVVDVVGADRVPLLGEGDGRLTADPGRGAGDEHASRGGHT